MDDKKGYWRAAVLFAIEKRITSIIAEAGAPITQSSLARELSGNGIREDAHAVGIVLETLVLSYFERIDSPFASPRFIQDEKLSEALIDGWPINPASTLFDIMAADSGIQPIWDSYRRFGKDWLLESVKNIGGIGAVFDLGSEDKAESDDWEPLAVDYDSVDAAPAMEAIEVAVEAIEQDNGYSATYPAERDSIVHSLRSALMHMRVRGEYTMYYFRHSVVLPLRKAAIRLRDSATGKIVEAAIKGVQKWISEHVFNLLNGP